MATMCKRKPRKPFIKYELLLLTKRGEIHSFLQSKQFKKCLSTFHGLADMLYVKEAEGRSKMSSYLIIIKDFS